MRVGGAGRKLSRGALNSRRIAIRSDEESAICSTVLLRRDFISADFYRQYQGLPSTRLVRSILECCFKILTAVKHADDGNLFPIHIEGNHGAPLVIRDAQAGTNIVAPGAAQREGLQALAVVE